MVFYIIEPKDNNIYESIYESIYKSIYKSINNINNLLKQQNIL